MIICTEQSNGKWKSSFCRELAPHLHLGQQGSSHQAPWNENQMLPQKIPTDMETWERKTIPYLAFAYNKGNPFGRTISTGWCYWEDTMRFTFFYIILTYRLIFNVGAKTYVNHIHVSYGTEQALNVLYICIYTNSSFFYAWQRNTMNIYVSVREVYKADPAS